MEILSPILVKVKTLPHFRGTLPAYKSKGASGLDVCALLESKILTLGSLERKLLSTGLCFEIPVGWEFQIRPRSGLAISRGLALLNSPGTIDSDYRGELKLIVINLSQNKLIIKNGERIAQLILCPIGKVKWDLKQVLGKTPRADKGLGSTGV